MRYAALIYVPEGGPVAPGLLGEYMDFSQSASQAGVMTGGERLAESSSATTVRVRGGKRATSGTLICSGNDSATLGTRKE